MGKIFCLMGKSSSGKDTIFSEIKNKYKDRLVPVVPYTTRPMRVGEVEGKEYHFINEDQLNEFAAQGRIIEQRVYQTVNGPWHYATIDDGSIDLEDSQYIMIATLEAYNSLVAYYGQASIVPIYINVEDGIRLERAINREKQQIEPNYDELCRRFLADNKDFSMDNLKAANITRFYINDKIEKCIQEISETIEAYLHNE